MIVLARWARRSGGCCSGRKPAAVTRGGRARARAHRPRDADRRRAVRVGRGRREAWLDGLRARRGRAAPRRSTTAVRELNRVLRAHRAAALDPYAREVSAGGALVVRVGYGSGDAGGRRPLRRRVRAAARGGRRGRARPERRRAALRRRSGWRRSWAAATRVLAGEELVLRARADLDAGRPREAALQARVALEALIAELRPRGRDVGELRDAPGGASATRRTRRSTGELERGARATRSPTRSTRWSARCATAPPG